MHFIFCFTFIAFWTYHKKRPNFNYLILMFLDLARFETTTTKCGAGCQAAQSDLYYPLVAHKNWGTQLVLPFELLLYSPYTFSHVGQFIWDHPSQNLISIPQPNFWPKRRILMKMFSDRYTSKIKPFFIESVGSKADINTMNLTLI